jgi:DNA-binding PadR family transcriptional regulator
MADYSPITYGLLGTLATRSWTGYELTGQVRRSLRFVWPASEGHLYREQKRLIALGWATVEQEPAGRRSRNRLSITAAGREALAEWLRTEPDEPQFQVEGVLRTFFADSGSRDDLAASMQATAEKARAMLDEMLGFVDEYLAEGGAVSMLERPSVGGTREFRGRTMYPHRLHVVALAIDVTTQLLKTLDDFFTESGEQVRTWPSTTDASLAPATRSRLERVRGRRPGRAHAPEEAPTSG